jgi:putative transposase
MSNPEKIFKIKQTMQANKIRRVGMDIKVFEVKIDESHLSKNKLFLLKSCFIQAKWLYNNIIAQNSIFNFDCKTQTIDVAVFNEETQKCDKIENRPLSIGSQIKQSIVKRAIQNVINLSKAKKKGIKTGRLKFVKEVNCIPLKQFGTTFKIKNENNIVVQGIGKLKVVGLDQLKKSGYEIANANLIKNASGFFLKITCYCPKTQRAKIGEIGLDFGIKDSIVDSNGKKTNFNFQVHSKIKKKHKILSKKKKGSKNRLKQIKRVKKSYEKLNRQKNDAANQFVNSLKNYDKVVIQDESIKNWQSGNFGKQVQNSILGRIKAKIKNLETSVIIDRFLPTTKISPINGEIIKIGLNERVFRHLDFSEDRDVKSAKTILCFGLNKPKITHKELMSLPAEERASIFSNYKFERNKLIPAKQEATAL